MPQYHVTIGGVTYKVDSARELDDASAYQAALASSHGAHGAPAAPPPSIPAAPSRPVDSSEPTSYAGGFWKGLKDYAKDMVSDPTTMAMVGAGTAAALTPVTGGLSALAVPFLGAAGGAGVAHSVKQMRSGVPESSVDVLSSMGEQGAVNAALANIPAGARMAGPKLLARADRLATLPALERHAPAAAAGLFTHNPAIAGVVEAAQTPMVNRAAGKALNAVGTIPEVAGKMFGGGAARVAEDMAVDPYLPSKSGIRMSSEVPGSSYPTPVAPSAPEPALPRSMSAIADEGRYMPNRSGYAPGDVAPASDLSSLKSLDAMTQDAGVVQGADIYHDPAFMRRASVAPEPAARPVVGAGDAPANTLPFQTSMTDTPAAPSSLDALDTVSGTRSLMHPQTAFGTAPTEMSDAAVEGAAAGIRQPKPTSRAMQDVVERRQNNFGAPSGMSDRRVFEVANNARVAPGAPRAAAIEIERDVMEALKGLGYKDRIAREAAQSGAANGNSLDAALRYALGTLTPAR